ncbi:MAG TPA: hypothetical protein PKW30_04530, partial [Campylobacterales bacterium]|nr:hypothetical protein [Campylobacterales bacterium]
MDKVELKRSNQIYVEIENFNDYEFTNNIAYEMAIRNLKVAALGFGLDMVFLKEKRERKYNPEFFKDDKIYMSIEELNIRYRLRNEFYITWLHYDLDQEYSKYYHFSDDPATIFGTNSLQFPQAKK